MKRIILALVSVALAEGLAVAQDRVIVTNVLPTEVLSWNAFDHVFDLDSRRLLLSGSSLVEGTLAHTGTTPAITGDGAFVLWTAAHVTAFPTLHALVYRDLASGQAGVLHAATLSGGGAIRVVGHPRHQGVFVSFASGVVALLDGSGLRGIQICGASDLAPSSDGRLLAILCDGTRIVIVDTSTGAIARELTVGTLTQRITFSADSRRLVGQTSYQSGPLKMTTLSVFDAESGQTLATFDAHQSADPRPIAWSALHVRRDEVVIRGPLTGSAGSIMALDASTLAVIRGWPVTDATALAFTSDGLKAAALLERDPATRRLKMALLDLSTPAVLEVQALGFYGTPGRAAILVASAPLAPTDLAATVVGHRVSLSYTLPVVSAMASDYIIEAAPISAPVGTYPIRVRSGSSEAGFTVAGAPSGVYRVRVRGVNAVGEGKPSASIDITVP